MGLFDFVKGRSDEKDIVDITQPLGAGESVNPPAGLRVENSESAETIRKAKRARNKPDAPRGGAFSLEADNTAQLAEQAKVLESLLDPKVWKGAVSAPGDAMVAVTGREHWKLSNDESDTLAKTGAATVRCFMVTDPKWLALSLFGFSVLSIYGSRFMKDLKDKRDAMKNEPLKNAT